MFLVQFRRHGQDLDAPRDQLHHPVGDQRVVVRLRPLPAAGEQLDDVPHGLGPRRAGHGRQGRRVGDGHRLSSRERGDRAISYHVAMSDTPVPKSAILVVDDEQEHAAVMCEALQPAGAQVRRHLQPGRRPGEAEPQELRRGRDRPDDGGPAGRAGGAAAGQADGAAAAGAVGDGRQRRPDQQAGDDRGGVRLHRQAARLGGLPPAGEPGGRAGQFAAAEHGAAGAAAGEQRVRGHRRHEPGHAAGGAHGPPGGQQRHSGA